MFIPGMRATYRAFKESQARRSAVRTLSGLDDTMLKDIGVSRSEIDAVVAGLPFARGARV